MTQSRPLFVFYWSFFHHISNANWKSINGLVVIEPGAKYCRWIHWAMAILSTVNLFIIKILVIQTAGLWYWKQPLYQPSHNHCSPSGLFFVWLSKAMFNISRLNKLDAIKVLRQTPLTLFPLFYLPNFIRENFSTEKKVFRFVLIGTSVCITLTMSKYLDMYVCMYYRYRNSFTL